MSFADILIAFANAGVTPMRVFVDDVSRRPPIVAFAILAHQEEASEMIAAGTLPLSVGEARLSRPKTSRDLPSSSVKHEHALLRWKPFDIEWKVLLIRRANDAREIQTKGYPIRAAFGLGAIWQKRLDEFSNELTRPWNDSRIDEQIHATKSSAIPSMPPPQREVRRANKRLIVVIRGGTASEEGPTTSARATEVDSRHATEVAGTTKPDIKLVRVNSTNAARTKHERITYTDSEDSD